MSIRQLYELQLVDSDVDVREKSLAEVRLQLSDDSELVAAKRRISELDERLEEQASARRPVELRIRDIEDKLKTVDARLYGGSITNQRELEAQQEQRQYLQEQHTTEEDQLLELMVASEETQNELDAVTSLATEIETRRKQAQPELTASEEALSIELRELEAERKEIAALISPSDLALYDSLRKSRGGQAVARVERGMCQGCRLSLPSTDVQRAKTSTGRVRCNSCQRILFVQ